MRAHDALLQSMRLFRSKGTTDNEQLMHAYSLMLSSSIDTSIIPHVLTVVEPGASSRFSARYTSSAVLYLSELYIHRCARSRCCGHVARATYHVNCGTRVYSAILFNIFA
jgi:hypothetical protein